MKLREQAKLNAAAAREEGDPGSGQQGTKPRGREEKKKEGKEAEEEAEGILGPQDEAEGTGKVKRRRGQRGEEKFKEAAE